MSRTLQAALLTLLLTAATHSQTGHSQNAALYGTVYGADGNPMTGVRVTLENPNLGFTRATTTGSDGAYTFAEVPPAEGYKLTATKGGTTLDIRAGITLSVGEEQVLRPALREQAASWGSEQNTLKISSQPGSAQVYLDDAPKGITSPDEGKLVLENLRTGMHKLRIGLSGYTDWIQSVTLTEGSTLYIDAKLSVAGPLPLTSQDVVDLLKGGVSAKRSADLVKERGVDFELTDPLEKDVRAAGGDDTLLLAITRAKAPPPPSPPPAVPPTITLLEPAGAESGKPIEAAGPSFRVHGTASHPSGIASVSVNGQVALMKPLTPESVEFEVPNLTVGSGSGTITVMATATNQSQLQSLVKFAPQVAERPSSPASGSAAPSPSFESFENDTFRISYPGNWDVRRDSTSSVTIAPQGGSLGNVLTCGVVIVRYQPRGRASLDIATRQLVEALLHPNPEMKLIGEMEDIRVNGLPAKSADFINVSSRDGGPERDWLIDLNLPDGSLLYLVFAVPERDREQFRPTFETMLRSLHLTPSKPPADRQ